MSGLFRIVVIAFTALFTFSASATSLPTSRYQNKYNVLLVYAQSPNDPEIMKTRLMVDANKENLKAHELVVLGIYPTSVELVFGPEKEEVASGISLANDLRFCFVVKENVFRTIVLGKDGVQKARALTSLSYEDLAGALSVSNAQIDFSGTPRIN
ncbi:MAG: DUF4174 domain-containing protein [Rhizobiales bacterium]|nr:DUF4174 domain-containing protein [Hyphomicrobiales bacterium]